MMQAAIDAAERGMQATAMSHMDNLCLDVATVTRKEERARVLDEVEKWAREHGDHGCCSIYDFLLIARAK